MSRARTPVDAGYTMIEMIVTIALAGTLMAIAVSGWQGWARASEQDGFLTELRAEMRQAQQRAVTTGSSICVRFDATAETYTVLQGRCDATTTVIQNARTAPAGVDLDGPVFQHGTDHTEPGVTFTSRGTATPGQVYVQRDGGPRTKLKVEGLTGRVSMS